MRKDITSSVKAADTALTQFGLVAEDAKEAINAIGVLDIMADGEARIRIWEQQYPDSLEKIQNAFGTLNPSIKQIVDWKRSWRELDLYTDTWSSKTVIKKKMNNIQVHPFFWDYRIIDINECKTTYITRVVFCDEETQFLAKLHYGNDL